ncbi:MAG: SDR family NAD(P)-dependent oxidoreductase [Cyanobacteria bacterium P01_D01_bin.105]
MSKSHSLENKVALVTSSSPGTCADMAKLLASAGAKVVICGRNANQGLATVRQIRQGGGRATFVLADIAVIADVRAMIDETIATYGRLDILLNNVSNSYAQDAPLPDVSESVWDRIIEPLLKGTFFCCQLSIPFLQQCDGGTIINLIEKTPGLQGRSVSNICQGGTVAMTSAIAQQFNSSAVTANLICVTPLASDISRDLLLSKIVIANPNVDKPFASVGDAVMYLAQEGHTLRGAALLVHTVEENAPKVHTGKAYSAESAPPSNPSSPDSSVLDSSVSDSSVPDSSISDDSSTNS